MFRSISIFFDFFFHHDFLSKPLQFTANLYFRTLSLQRGAHFNKNLIIYIWSGTIFSRRPTLGRVSFERCANSTFSIFVFIFFQKWVWRQLHTLGLWTPLREAILSPNPLFYLRNLMFFFKTINFTKGIWYFSVLGGFWGASGVPGPLLETISGFRWSHHRSWKLSGALFGCIWDFFGLLFELFAPLWDHIF